ncbi:hypothetical protein [Nocardia sp. NPDC046763]|uniref:hypothetical protein n=1 Tax=Nocardia sp. NPDC046763 TaxID=3155256 RepID=UPI00341052A7
MTSRVVVPRWLPRLRRQPGAAAGHGGDGGPALVAVAVGAGVAQHAAEGQRDARRARWNNRAGEAASADYR